MICLDTTFLIQLWRNRRLADHPTARLLAENPAETIAVPVAAAGEFLEGAAYIFATRLTDAVHFLTLFELGPNSLQTARH